MPYRECACGAPWPGFGVGAIWMCFACWSMSPDGAELALERARAINKEALHEQSR